MKKDIYYPFLDGFRAIALLMVILHHSRRGFDLDNLFSSNPPILSWFYFKSLNVFHMDLTWTYIVIQQSIYKIKGVLGVQIFFVISGFLITRGLLAAKLDRHSIKRFYLRRFFRVYPAYILMVIISLVVLSINTTFELREFVGTLLKQALFLQNYFQRNFILEHTWTMVVFEHFYFIAPLCMWGIVKCIKTSKMRWLFLFGLFIMLKWLAPIIRNFYLQTGEVFIQQPLKAPYPYFTTIYHMGSFGVGGLLALLEIWANQFKKSRLIGLPFWILGVVIYWILYFKIDWNYNYGPWYLYSLGSFACACLMIAAYQGVAILVNIKWLQFIGRCAYGIYIWHILVFLFCIRFVNIIPISLLFLMYLALAVIVGFISTKTIEQYFLKLFKGLDCLNK